MKRIIANAFGTLGYVSLLMQWLWVALTLGYPLIANETFKAAFLPEPTPSATPSLSITTPEPIATIFMVVAVIFALSVTVYMIFSVPRTIGRVGNKVTIKSAEKIVPYVTHHKKVSKKRQKTLLERSTWSVKLILAVLPALISLLPLSEKVELSSSVVSGVAVLCASLTLLYFGCQFIIAKIGKIDPNDIW